VVVRRHGEYLDVLDAVVHEVEDLELLQLIEALDGGDSIEGEVEVLQVDEGGQVLHRLYLIVVQVEVGERLRQTRRVVVDLLQSHHIGD